MVAGNTEDYEEQCQRNRDANKAILRGLGIDGPIIPVRKTKESRAPRKRERSVTQGELDRDPRPKIARTESIPGGDGATGLRRSGRNAGRKVDYVGESVADPTTRLVRATKGVKGTTEPRSLNKRIYDPKTFGAIPGISVGTWWLSREECSADAIHAPWVAGIAGGPEGAYSVALSGGYEDDVDLGDAFTYTGAGGRDLRGTKQAPKNLRTAPQSCDQSFENRLNKALKISSETKKPVRVIRGFKLKSPYAPSEGYRYDGLYTIEKAWMEKGLNPKGWKVCKFAFKRVPGQAPLQLSNGDSSNGEAEDGDNDSQRESSPRYDDSD